MNGNSSTIFPRGICNVSKVSCHIACAVQILCHAIPTVRAALRRILDDAKESDAIPGIDTDSSLLPVTVSVSLLEELLDFVRADRSNGNGDGDGDENRENNSETFVSGGKPWNPERLYSFLANAGDTTGGFSLDPDNVGDATRSLSCLLHLLSHERAPCGPAWKRILESSVWEGETLQILEGRRLLADVEDDGNNDLDRDCGDDGVRRVVEQRRFLQRIKPALRNKSMASPLILKFRDPEDHATTGTSRRDNNNTVEGCSVIRALKEVFEPQTIQGSNYPWWENLSPDTYSEREIVCPISRNLDDCTDDSESSSCTDSGVECNDDGSSSSSSSSDSSDDSSSSSSSDDSIEGWVTTKRIDVRCIPRIWLLHLERPRASIEKIRRMVTTQHTQETDSGKPFSLFDQIQVPIELETSSILTTKTNGDGDGGPSSNDDLREEMDKKQDDQNAESIVSPPRLFLRGAIVQVVEIEEDDDELEEDWEGGHSITLLRNAKGNESGSWVLVDDDHHRPISEDRAIRMMGGAVETNRDAQNKIDGNGNCTSSSTYFSASLLVYSVPDDDCNEEWKQHEDDLVSSWKDHRAKVAAQIKAKESLVGKRLRVKWAKGKLYVGTITRYDLSSGKHQVTYDDGYVKEYNLNQKTVEWIDPID